MVKYSRSVSLTDSLLGPAAAHNNPFLSFPRDMCIEKDPLEQKLFIDLFFKDTDKLYRQY